MDSDVHRLTQPPLDNRPLYVKLVLRSIGYRYSSCALKKRAYYLELARTLCDSDESVLDHLRRTTVSCGVLSLLVGLASRSYGTFVLAGFSLGDSKAFAGPVKGRNMHFDTDRAVLNYLCSKHGTIFTTEPELSGITSVPLLPS